MRAPMCGSTGVWPLVAQRLGEGAVAVNADLACLDQLGQSGVVLQYREACAGVEGELGVGVLGQAVTVAGRGVVEQDVEGAFIELYVHEACAGSGKLSEPRSKVGSSCAARASL